MDEKDRHISRIKEAVKKAVEHMAPPQDCATCEHLNMDQTMPGSDIPIAYCPKIYEIEDSDKDESEYTKEELAKYEQAEEFWAHKVYKCPFYTQEMTREQLKARIEQLELEIRDFCDDCEYRDGYCNNEPPPWTDLD